MSKIPERIWLFHPDCIVSDFDEADDRVVDVRIRDRLPEKFQHNWKEYHRSPEWVSVEDLPKSDGFYWVAYEFENHDRGTGEAYFDILEKEWEFPQWSGQECLSLSSPIVTHWMPLPAPPEDK